MLVTCQVKFRFPGKATLNKLVRKSRRSFCSMSTQNSLYPFKVDSSARLSKIGEHNAKSMQLCSKV